MVEDFCKQIKDKTTLVEVSDRAALFAEPALGAMITRDDRGRAASLVFMGDWSWIDANRRMDDDDDIDPTEDVEWVPAGEDVGILAAISMLKQKNSGAPIELTCAYFDAANDDNHKLPTGTKFLGEDNDDAGTITTLEAKSDSPRLPSP